MTGVEVDRAPRADIGTIRHGKAVRFRRFNHPGEALEAVRLRD
jgi:hypothetical protein